MTNRIIVVLLSVLNRLLWKYRAKVEYQPIFEKLFMMSVYGRNFGRHGGIVESGEFYMLKNILKRYFNKSNKLIFFDVGAFQGDYTDALIQHFSEYNLTGYLFEPSKQSFKIITDKYKSQIGIKCFNVALSNIEGYGSLTNEGTSISHLTIHENERTSAERRTVIKTLKTICETSNIKHIDFLKLDVEGEELNVLSGGSEMIRSGSISVIQFEHSYASVRNDKLLSFKVIFSFLSENYVIYRIMKNGFYRIERASALDEVYFGANYLAVHKSLDSELSEN